MKMFILFPDLIFSAMLLFLSWNDLSVHLSCLFHLAKTKREQPLSDSEQKITVYMWRYRFKINISKHTHSNEADSAGTHKHTQHKTDRQAAKRLTV